MTELKEWIESQTNDLLADIRDKVKYGAPSEHIRILQVRLHVFQDVLDKIKNFENDALYRQNTPCRPPELTEEEKRMHDEFYNLPLLKNDLQNTKD